MRLNWIAPDNLPIFNRALARLQTDLVKIAGRMRAECYPKRLDLLDIMVLIGEDRRFFYHPGFDLKSVVRESIRLLTFRRHGGASTIDMQLVRTITGYRKRTISRKLYEICLAFLVQHRYSKFEILRTYLSCAFLGSHLIGMEAASIKVFGKTIPSLSIEEAAFLSAMLVYPMPLVPTTSWHAKVKRRASYIAALYPRLKRDFETVVIDPDFAEARKPPRGFRRRA